MRVIMKYGIYFRVYIMNINILSVQHAVDAFVAVSGDNDVGVLVDKGVYGDMESACTPVYEHE